LEYCLDEKEKLNTEQPGLIKQLFLVEKRELRATAIAFLFVFILMSSWFILRPVRDAMASDWSDAEVSFLWGLNFFVCAILVAIYGFAISRVKFKWLAPGVYAIFAFSFITYYLCAGLVGDRALLDKAFYVWVSVFSLFHLSVFWSLMSDTFDQEQAKRLFAIIAAGASLGAILGSAIATLFAKMVGVDMLMLIASIGLLLVIPLAFYMYSVKENLLGNSDVHADFSQAKLGGHWWSGFKTVLTNPYFMSIAVFLVLYTFIGSFIYFAQKNMLAEFSRAERTQILGGIDWIINMLTFGIAFLATSRIVRHFGMPTTLAILPVFVLVALLILAFAPILTILLALQIARRSGNYAITKPAREMLFTEVSQEDRFKAKPVIDIVLYRGGDWVSSMAFAALTGLGLGMVGVSLVGAGIAAVWACVGLWLGRKYDKKVQER